MKLNAMILFCILAMLHSCNGQNATTVSNSAAREQATGFALDDTVSELDKTIFIVFQDRNGHYWFGSDGQGVYRYDGKTTLHFTTKDGLLNNRIRGIQEDKSGNVFITSLEGINKFDGRTFTALPVTETNEWKLDSNDLWFSILGGKGEDGPYRYDGKTLHHLKFPKHPLEDKYYRDFPNSPWSPYEVYTIYKDSKGHIWLGTSNFGICRYDGKKLSWMYEEHLTLIEGGGSFGIRSIIEDKEGKFWFCNTSHRYNILPLDSTMQHGALINYKREKGIEGIKTSGGKDMFYFMSAIKDNKGDLWMATYNKGVWRYNGKTITHYSVKDGAKEITLFSIYRNQRGDIWLGTHEAGAYQFNGKAFEKFRP